ncbi:exosortase C-terminal domain/associated protein EpsI [Planctomycetota bacterium]
MAKNTKSNHKPVVIAAVAASFLMLFLGLGYRVLAVRLAAPVDSIPISPEALQQLPLEMGGWTGQEVSLDEAIVEATDTDAYINRHYLRKNGLESVSLYIASGVRTRDLMTHRPEVCYTGNGWTLTDRRSIELPLSNGIKLPCNVLQFSRGALNAQKVMVLDYYLVDGQYCRDVSLLRSKAWRGSGTVDYVAQIQITTSIKATQTAHSAQAIVADFAVESASLIAKLFEDAGGNRPSDKDPSEANNVYEELENG